MDDLGCRKRQSRRTLSIKKPVFSHASFRTTEDTGEVFNEDWQSICCKLRFGPPYRLVNTAAVEGDALDERR